MKRALVALALLAACSPPPVEETPDAGTPLKPAPDTTVFGGDRPTTLLVPSTYDHATPTPLVLMLHGLGGAGWFQLAYFGMDRIAEDYGVLVLSPDGNAGPNGSFWNGTDACCDWERTGVDDVAYLTGLIRDAVAEYNVDERRIYVVGHSNGGFMTYRLACDHPELFAGVVSLAGAMWNDPARCPGGTALSVVQIHGTADDIVFYEGETVAGVTYPSAQRTIQMWGQKDGCTGALGDEEPGIDIDGATNGAETGVRRTAGCPDGVDVELWTVHGGLHVPGLNANFRNVLWQWLAAHPKR